MDTGRLLSVGVDRIELRDVHRCLSLDHAPLRVLGIRLGAACDEINALDDGRLLGGVDLQDATLLALILARVDEDVVALLYV